MIVSSCKFVFRRSHYLYSIHFFFSTKSPNLSKSRVRDPTEDVSNDDDDDDDNDE